MVEKFPSDRQHADSGSQHEVSSDRFEVIRAEGESDEEFAKRFRAASIDAIENNGALPTAEAMNFDPEVAQAFQNRLEGMSAEELEKFNQELESAIEAIHTEGKVEVATRMVSSMLKGTGFGFAAAATGVLTGGAGLISIAPAIALIAGCFLAAREQLKQHGSDIKVAALERGENNARTLLEAVKTVESQEHPASAN